MFRPCIDLHQGKVKQIVGGSLRDDEAAPETNFVSERPASWFAELYKKDGLEGGHVIMLGPGNESAAREALGAWPGGMQVGGGVTPDNAWDYLVAGASHVIVTSWVFRDGMVDFDRVEEISWLVGRERLVLDLSCRRRDDAYYVVTDRWRRFTDFAINEANLARLARWCDEFLVHAVDVEGKRAGVDEALIRLLAESSAIPTTYAGGAATLDDLRRVEKLGSGRIDVTMGSALDIFGGQTPYRDVVSWHRKVLRQRRRI